MKELRTDDPERLRAAGVIDLPTLQRFLNFHFSVSVDLFGQERSTNAATYFTTGLKGRYHETRIDDDHGLTEATWPVQRLQENRIVCEDEPALLALNERLRDDYIADSQRGINRWNRVLEQHGSDFRLVLPHRAFHRAIGGFADTCVAPDGRLLTEAEWRQQAGDWLPTDADHVFVDTLMQPVTEPGKMASWISPPSRGINGQTIDFEYVKFGS
jgi:benzoyl-CoA 2,3-dioxygenase component B